MAKYNYEYYSSGLTCPTSTGSDRMYTRITFTSGVYPTNFQISGVIKGKASNGAFPYVGALYVSFRSANTTYLIDTHTFTTTPSSWSPGGKIPRDVSLANTTDPVIIIERHPDCKQNATFVEESHTNKVYYRFSGPNTYTAAVTSGSGSGTYTSGQTFGITANTPGTGKQFLRWSASDGTFANAQNSSTTFTMPTNDVSIYASYMDTVYQLTVRNVSLVTITTYAKTYGSVVSLTAPSATGYTFKNWTATGGSFSNTTATSTSFTMPAANTTVSMNYSLNTYTISKTISPSTGGSLSITPTYTSSGTSYVYYDDVITSTATANTGYTFDHFTYNNVLGYATINPNVSRVPPLNLNVTAYFLHNTYTIGKAVSPSGGGSVSLSSSTGYYNDKIQATATASAGYAFKNWSAPNGSFSNTTSNPTTYTLTTANSTITANFTHVQRTLSTAASPSAGGSVTAGATLYYNDKKQLTATANTGYTFSSWSKSSGTLSSTTANPTTFTMPDANATVTANFTHNTYTLTTKALTGGSVTAGATLYYNDKKQLTATPNTGYSFASWTKSAGTLSSTTSNPTTFTMPNGSATVTASFTHNTYTLTTKALTGGSVTAGANLYYNDKKQLTATANTGYTFSGWTKSAGTLSSTTSNPTTFTMPAGAATVTASFTHNTYSVTKASNPSAGGNTTISASSGYYNDKIQIKAAANTGYAFSSWSKSGGTITNASAATTTFTLPAGNSTVTANFTHVQRTLSTTVSPSGGGTVTAGATLYYNDKKQLTASASTGYAFSSWTASSGTLSSSTANPTTFTMPNNNATVTANFTHVQRTLTTSVSPSGGGTVTAGATLYYNDKKQLSATASTGYSFSSWTATAGTLSNATANPTTFTMPNSNASVTANFTHNTYALSTSVSPFGGGTVTSGANLYYNDKKQLTATANTGYSFSSWSNTGGSLSSTTSNPTTFTMPAGAASVTANFTHNTFALTTNATPAEGGTVTSGATLYYNDKKQLTATPSTGYSFAGWTATAGSFSSTSATPTTFTMPNGAASVTASFTHNTYTVTGVVNPGNGNTVTFNKTTAYYNDSIIATATPAVGYHFASWTTSPSTSITNNIFNMPNSNITVTANFELTDYSITPNVYPSGKGTLVASSLTANYGDVITLTPVTVTGYRFDGYTISPNIEIVNNQFVMPAQDVSVTANFVSDIVTITSTSNISDGGTYTKINKAYTVGSQISISAAPSIGYNFVNWTADHGTFTNNTATATIYTVGDSSATITANFVKTHNLVPVEVGDISWTTANGSLTLSGNFINTSEIVSPNTAVPAKLHLVLGVKS